MHLLDTWYLIQFFLTLIPWFQVVSGRCLAYAFWPSALFNSTFGVSVIFILFVIPLIILMYCYGRIVWVLTSRIDAELVTSPQGNSSDNKMQTNIRDKFQLARQNTIKTFLLVGLCFIICWSNDQIFFLMFNLGYDVDFNGIYYKFGVLMVFLNCTINPLIYLIKYRDFQHALKELFGCDRVESNSRLSSTIVTENVTITS